ncbi:MAG: hypothetical protein ACRD0X_02315 [Thermoanaerobaculia bacterium]
MAEQSSAELPRRAWRHLGRWLGRAWLAPWGAHRLRVTLAASGERLAGGFFVIAPPRSWELLRPCLQLLRERVPVCVVGNGAGRDERARFSRAFPEIPRCELPTLPGALWSHGSALNLLLREVTAPFGIVDHDCYVFGDELLAGLGCGERELTLAVDLPGFFTWNERAGLRLPRTHWLFLNAPLLRDLMRRHEMGCEKAERTPLRVASLLATVGFGDRNFPPPHLPFYDTLHLLLAVGLAEGHTVRYLPASDADIVHFGGATRQRLRRLPDC